VNYNAEPASLLKTTSTYFEIRFHLRVHNVHTYDEFGVDTVSLQFYNNVWGGVVYFGGACCK